MDPAREIRDRWRKRRLVELLLGAPERVIAAEVDGERCEYVPAVHFAQREGGLSRSWTLLAPDAFDTARAAAGLLRAAEHDASLPGAAAQATSVRVRWGLLGEVHPYARQLVDLALAALARFEPAILAGPPGPLASQDAWTLELRAAPRRLRLDFAAADAPELARELQRLAEELRSRRLDTDGWEELFDRDPNAAGSMRHWRRPLP